MKVFQFKVTDKDGIHARPAGQFVKLAAGYESNVQISKEGKSADAKRIFGVMGLGVKQGQEITISIEGADEEQAASELESFLKENL